MSKIFKTTVLVSVGNENATLDDVRYFLNDAMIVNVDTETYGDDVDFECVEILLDDLEEMILADTYENRECPDCHEKIPVDTKEDEACKNCGHVFCFPRSND